MGRSSKIVLSEVNMLSIIIPTLNEEKCLPLLLESIKKQSVSRTVLDENNFEIIVADAGSKDKTVEIAKTYGCKIVKGGLPAKGRNEGAEVARGDLLLFLDADMTLPENFLEKVLKEFKERNLDIAGFLMDPLTRNNFLKFLFNLFYNWPVLALARVLAHAAQVILVKKNLHQKLKGFDETIKLAEDHDYAKRAKKIGKFGIIRTPRFFSSLRRFEKDGWVKTYLTYILCESHMIFLGPVKSEIFKYKFNHYEKK